MRVFGKRVPEYAAFCKAFLTAIVIVGIARLALSLGGAPNSTAKWLSINVVASIGALYYAVRVHTSGFGSYKQLLPIYFLQSVAAQAVIVPGIILAIVTRHDNIFSAPEYSFGGDGKTWSHVAAHLLLGTTFAPLMSWLVGCAIMFVTKRVADRKGAPTTQRA